MSKNVLDEILEDNNVVDLMDDSSEEDDEILEPLLDEINLINDNSIRLFVRLILLNVPSYFWTTPCYAENEEANNPPDELKEGGLILHIQRVVRIILLFGLAQERTPLEKDILISAALLHDITRYMDNDGELLFDPMHPYTASAFIDQLYLNDNTIDTEFVLDEGVYQQILRLIRCHKGIWSPVPETFPLTNLEWMIHMADLMACRVHAIVDGVENVKEERWEI